MPTPNRARKSVKALTARPDRKTNTREDGGGGGDDRRSPDSGRPASPWAARPRTRNALDAALMKTITPSLTPKLSRMSGASTPSVAPSRFSTHVEQEQHDEREGPPDAQALAAGSAARRRRRGAGRRRRGPPRPPGRPGARPPRRGRRRPATRLRSCPPCRSRRPCRSPRVLPVVSSCAPPGPPREVVC